LILHGAHAKVKTAGFGLLVKLVGGGGQEAGFHGRERENPRGEKPGGEELFGRLETVGRRFPLCSRSKPSKSPVLELAQRRERQGRIGLETVPDCCGDQNPEGRSSGVLPG
jgi:hypothetical protein